ncbi:MULTISPECIES: LysR family transcriptional regulator [unclassified Paraburkholderia]|uniref:LysR family transcriptional regulator n=1 Tax=unclassified Paraburkholderia TaxID=2615204 RepID=UPI00160B77E4|nr:MULTISPECIES: LysR family transcriptional regulator [unclassified Paraburkholderia]MBB5448380.1 DNA-binding transcriptional LysR family regulator [Paraburkholderia sp. WSM4177]MBB5488764.1 DNA-binding transcriptional LysR family regulator [Paraburkholderia sp. WSM4180]
MPRQITLRQIEYFLSVADTGQISHSSNLCNVSQSSMTIALQNLEDAVGVPLLSRHAKGVRLTDAGVRFMRHVQQARQSVQEAVLAAQEVPEQISGRVCVGKTETISAYLLPSLMSTVTRRFRNLQVEVIERERETIERQLLDGELDMALLLVSNTALHDDLKCETMIRSPRRLWTPPDHPLLEAQRVTLGDVAQENYLLLDMDEHVQTVARYWGKYGVTPRVRMQSTSIEAVRSLVALGEGVTILSDLVYRPWSLEGNRISRRDLSVAVPTMDVGAVWRRNVTLSRQVRTLLDLFRSWKHSTL